MMLEYLPTWLCHFWVNVGKYSIHGASVKCSKCSFFWVEKIFTNQYCCVFSQKWAWGKPPNQRCLDFCMLNEVNPRRNHTACISFYHVDLHGMVFFFNANMGRILSFPESWFEELQVITSCCERSTQFFGCRNSNCFKHHVSHRLPSSFLPSGKLP